MVGGIRGLGVATPSGVRGLAPGGLRLLVFGLGVWGRAPGAASAALSNLNGLATGRERKAWAASGILNLLRHATIFWLTWSKAFRYTESAP